MKKSVELLWNNEPSFNIIICKALDIHHKDKVIYFYPYIRDMYLP